jgi:cytochrome oxidase assembly protein ShyY1
MGMTVKTTSRSQRVVYLIAWLLFAVALTAALVLAGKRTPEEKKSSSLQSNTVPTLNTVCLLGNSNA